MKEQKIFQKYKKKIEIEADDKNELFKKQYIEIKDIFFQKLKEKYKFKDTHQFQK